MTPSSSAHSQSFASFQSDNSNHFFSSIEATSPSLLQYGPDRGSKQYYGSPSVALSNPTYESVQSCLLTTASMASTASTTEGGVISKSSSSDSDTNDSATRLISDSLADISNQHIYLMQTSSAVGTCEENNNSTTNAQHSTAPSREPKVNKQFSIDKTT